MEQQEASAEPYSFRNLGLWQKAQDMAVAVIDTAGRLPNTPAARSLSTQVIRSAGSVPANIAEGHGRYSVAAYRNHLSIARGSLCETESWLDLLRRSGFIGSDVELKLRQECHALLAGITQQMRRLERKLETDGVKVRDVEAEYVFDD